MTILLIVDGRLRFRHPDRAALRAAPSLPGGDPGFVIRQNAHAGLEIDAATLAPGSGESFALRDAVDPLVARAAGAR